MVSGQGTVIAFVHIGLKLVSWEKDGDDPLNNDYFLLFACRLQFRPCFQTHAVLCPP